MKYYFDLAIKAAMPKHLEDFDARGFILGAVGLRNDGTLVSAKNGAVHSTSIVHYKKIPMAHAEARLCRKLGKNGIVYVVRLARKDRALVMSRPCPSCQSILRAHEVSKVYYSINEHQYGLFLVQEDQDKVFNF